MITVPALLKIGAIALLGAVVIGCGGSSATPTPEPTPEPAAAAIEVIGNQFRYDPPEVTIPSAGSSTIRLVNKDVVEHDYTIDELEIHIPAPVGGSGEATLTDVAPGTYRVYCTVPGHEAAGMVGSLVVTE
jgi:nitrite reductase (NO-forming)